jgi:hypothetical protein
MNLILPFENKDLYVPSVPVLQTAHQQALHQEAVLNNLLRQTPQTNALLINLMCRLIS